MEPYDMTHPIVHVVMMNKKYIKQMPYFVEINMKES